MILFFQLSGIALAAATYKSPDFRRTVNIHCETPDAGTRCAWDCEKGLKECLNRCEGDYSCVSNCNRGYADCEQECPCFENCKSGCPCNHYSRWCENTMELMLVEPSRPPGIAGQPPYYWDTPVYLYQWEGQNEQAIQLDISPSIDELEAVQWKMCSFIINNEFYIMGGENEYKHQQLKLSGCGFQKLPDLPFRFDGGRCTSFNFHTLGMMCAGIQNPQTCHVFGGNNDFHLTSNSHWPHTTGGIVNANDKLFLLAGGNLEVEKYNHHDRNWLHLTPRTSLKDVVHRTAPDATAYLEFSTVGMNNTVFAIGGLYAYGNDGPDKHFTNGLLYAMDIATYEWRIFEQALLRARAWNRVVLFGASFALIGGENEHTDVERWTFNGRGYVTRVKVNFLGSRTLKLTFFFNKILINF